METIWQDIRFGFRMLAKGPAFTVIAVLTLALGIGANTAIFSAVNAILLRPLPYENPERLVFLSEWAQQVPSMSISMANFGDWRSMNTVFESMVAYRTNNVILTGEGEPERLLMRQATAGLFPTLKIKPIIGRVMTPEEDKVGAERVVLLGEGFWTRRFARDPGVLNKTLTLNGETYTVIGVLPTMGFHNTWSPYDLFASLWRLEDQLGGPANRGNHPGIYAFARMKPGVTIGQAEAEMKGIAKRLEQQYPNSNTGDSVTVQPILEAIVGDAQGQLYVLMGAVFFVLLIACSNVANLLLARASERQKEVAVRAALGAGRWRLVRQLLTESLLLSLMGGALGLLVGAWATDGLVKAAEGNVPRIQDVRMDGTVLLFTLGVSLLTGLFFGVFPALQMSRTDMHETLKEGGRGGGAGVGRRRLRNALVVTEVAVSLVLLIGAGLTLRSLYNVLSTNPGFDPAGVLVGNFTLPEAKYSEPAKRRIFVQQVLEKVQALPGVEAAAFKNPLLGNSQTSFLIEGQPIPKPGQFLSVDIGRITPDALKVMGTRLIRGRMITNQDNENGQHVCIVDETFANTHWPGEDPLGKRAALGGPPPPGQQSDWLSVVGVVAHVKHYGVDQPSRVEMYTPFAQNPALGGNLVLRVSAGDPAALSSALRSAVLSVDPEVPVYNIRTMQSIAESITAQRRLVVVLLGSLALLALLLAAVGLYGVMSYSVTQRGHEIGIRMALGAQRNDVFRQVLGNALTLMSTGVILGWGGAIYLRRFLGTLLFEVRPDDPMAFLGIPILLVAVGLLACYVPARRATQVDPIVALRYE
jgi:putative ABC transport system permease protein